jgi:hypothetical protein
MATLIISDAARNAAANAIVDLIDAGVGPGIIEIYDGAMPAGPGSAVTTQTLLATLIFSDPAFGDGEAGVVTAASITNDSAADASGTATWFRVKDSDGVAIADGDVSDEAGTGVLRLEDTALTAGIPVAINSFTFTMPSGE